MSRPKAKDRNPIELQAILAHLVTSYDRRTSRKAGYNYHALSMYLESVDDVVRKIASGMPRRQAVLEHFRGPLLNPCLKAVGESPSTPYERYEVIFA